MTLFTRIQPGTYLYDRQTGQRLLIDNCERHPALVFISFKNSQTGSISREPITLEQLERRFEIVEGDDHIFRADPAVVSLVAEAHRIEHAYLFNPLFATETSLIDLLPHQMAAVYGVPATDEHPARLGMLDIPRLRFLLADDAGAGKTIMAGLLIREMLLRRLAKRILVVPPAGLVGNWERELRTLFRLRFRPLTSVDAANDDNPFADPRNDLAIVSVDTLWRDRMRDAYMAAQPYDLVIFDEAHKLSAGYLADMTIDATRRYEMAELIAQQKRHLLLMSATPHMGKDDRYYMLWRLLEPELLPTQSAFQRLSPPQKQSYLLRRMKEEMVTFEGASLYVVRNSDTVLYPLSEGEFSERALYNEVTEYCDIHFDRAQERNRSAARLALSILQRRLASSTYALLKSLERREERISTAIHAIESEAIDEDEFRSHQEQIRAESTRDEKTGDEEEAVDGMEEAERRDRELEEATDALNLDELRIEYHELQRLVALARRVYERQQESKFERLWEVLENYPNEKVLIFTEFRDTLDFLVSRLESKGLTGKIAQIHGGMHYKDRDEQADFFRKSARVMAATDAAGEGINLQFCWLLFNYDIPWNPARLEQRMGRVHRYGQEHAVQIFNMLAAGTREGRVLDVLLEKLEAIRRELTNDKVFDIIGEQFRSRSMSDLIFAAVMQGQEAEVVTEIERDVTAANVLQIIDAQNERVEVSEVRALLRALQNKQEAAAMRRMMPAYIRRFVQLAAETLGIEIRGDIEQIFDIAQAPPSVRQALTTYSEAIQHRLTFDRELAKPDLTRVPQAVYLHPGEPVFESIVTLFLGDYEHEGMRGAIFQDSETEEPYIFYLARSTLLRDPYSPAGTNAVGVEQIETVQETMTGVRRYSDGRCELAPAHLLLTISGHQTGEPPHLDPWMKSAASDTTTVEAQLLATWGIPTLAQQKENENQRIPERLDQLRTAFNLRRAELMAQRRTLRDNVDRGVPAAASKLRACEAEQQSLDQERRQAEAELLTSPDRLKLGPVTFYAQALVLSLPLEEAEAREQVESEQIAIEEVKRRERAEGSTAIEDVSNPQLKNGFDLRVLRADGTVRYVEVKGCRSEAAVELEANEWAQAANHRDKYWLYVVFNCADVPTLLRIRDPFGALMGQETGAIRINVSQIKAAAERE